MNWQQLADEINAKPGHEVIMVGFVKELPVAFQHYQRALLRRVVLHENLFSMYFGWQAIFQPFWNRWTWVYPPEHDEGVVQIIDGDTTSAEPLLVHKGLVRITHDMWTGMLTHSEINPASTDPKLRPNIEMIKHGGPEQNHLEGGMWITSPGYPGTPFDTSKVVSAHFGQW